MHKSLTRCIAFFLLFAFSAFLIPNEFVHSFYGHKDTVEKVCNSNKESIGNHHIHCGFLQYEASLFTKSSAFYFPSSTDFVFTFCSVSPEQFEFTFFSFPSLRGPPALV